MMQTNDEGEELQLIEHEKSQRGRSLAITEQETKRQQTSFNSTT